MKENAKYRKDQTSIKEGKESNIPKREKAKKTNKIFINNHINREIDEKKSELAFSVIQSNKEIDRFKSEIDGLFINLDKKSNIFKDQRIITGKLNALKRMLYAMKAGLDRQRLKIYDVDEMSIRQEIMKDM